MFPATTVPATIRETNSTYRDARSRPTISDDPDEQYNRPGRNRDGEVTDMLTHPRWTACVGTPIDLYRGVVEFDWESETIAGEGQAWLGWFPSPRVFLSWGVDHPSALEIAHRAETIEVALPGVGSGVVQLNGTPDPPTSGGRFFPVTLSGAVNKFHIGNVDEPVAEVRFVVINGPELLGDPIDDDRGGFWRGRTTLETSNWRFLLDQRRDFSKVKSDLKWTHPYGLTHVGQLVHLDGAASALDDARDALDLLGYFLSFVKGASVAPVIPCGLDDAGMTVWEDWGSINRRVYPWRTSITWFEPLLTEYLAQLFTGFATRWAESEDQLVLRYALAFYEGSNDPRPLETGLTLAVTGLELMAWVYLVRGGTMADSDFDDQGMRPRTIRRLLDEVGIDTTRVPQPLTGLRRDGRLGHDAIWRLRTRYTHPRMGTIATDHNRLVEAWRLATWYLELVLLHWFNYSGPYGSRLKGGRWQGDTQLTPWTPDTTPE